MATEATEVIPFNLPGEGIAATAKRRAALAIENTFKFYEESLKSLEHRVAIKEKELDRAREARDESEGQCSKYIFGLAQFAFEAEAKVQPLEVFLACCAYAEANFKQKHGVSNLKDVLPVWAVFKSNIKIGIERGQDPRDYSSEWDFRKALITARTESLSHQITKTEPRRLERLSDEVTESPEPEVLRPIRSHEATELVAHTTIKEPLQVLVAQLVVGTEYVRKGSEDEAEEVLRRALASMARLVDLRRVKDEQTKKQLKLLTG